MRIAEAELQAVGDWIRAHAPPGADLQVDSRRVRAGDVFVALPGRRADGLDFLDAARGSGAAAALVDRDAWEARRGAVPALPVLPVAGIGATLGWIAARHYREPSAQLRTIGITGTNGKTSSCQWLAQLLGTQGIRCATIGTLGFGFPGALETEESALTTPDAAAVQRLARRALDSGAQALAIEASSIGLDQGRLNGLSIDVAVFTNLSRDHLDYHPDMEAYAAAKRRLFDWPTRPHGVLNIEDPFGAELAGELVRAGRGVTVVDLATADAPVAPFPVGSSTCRLRAQSIEHRADGMRFAVACEREGVVETEAVETAVVGEFNALNLLGVLGAALACGVALRPAAAALAGLQAPPGRLQRVPAERGPVAIVDYAHTPDAIRKALRALRPLAQSRGGRLCIVFGAGGDRDRGKRPAMAAAAAAEADAIVLTSDNPRGEDPESIIEQIARGLPAGAVFERDSDRAAAIGRALRGADERDVILIAGKGHEPYQEIAGRRLPFSDFAVARDALRSRAGARP